MVTKVSDTLTPAEAVPPRGAVGIDFARVLALPLANPLLGVEVCGDFYARDGFRFVGTCAAAGQEQLEAESQKFRSLFKLNPAAAARSCIRTGYDEHLRLGAEDIRESLTHLYNPRARLVHELFWPHVPDEIFVRIRLGRELNCRPVARELAEAAARTNGRERAILGHALAVIYHNLAIAHELSFAAGEADWSDEYWSRALAHWAETLASDYFWDYLHERVAGFDDPRLKADDVATLRRQLPAVLLGFHVQFARAYARAESRAACSRHLTFISRSGMAEEVQRESLQAAIRALTVARLEPLERRLEGEVLSHVGRFARQEFSRVCGPILTEARAAQSYLTEELALPEELARLAEFDLLCTKLLSALNGKLDYSMDDGPRCLLYCILLVNKMLDLPLSSATRRKLEQARQRDIETLYRELPPADGKLDPTRCWFLTGEESDPDASITLPVYKITNREVQVDYLRGSAGLNVAFEKRRVLVPRSSRAQATHENRLKVEDLPEESLDDTSKQLLTQIRGLEQADALPNLERCRSVRRRS
jgi:hypothetical protein